MDGNWKTKKELMAYLDDVLARDILIRPSPTVTDTTRCHECLGKIRIEYIFCPTCGQRIDWGDGYKDSREIVSENSRKVLDEVWYKKKK